jgi:hypothetical protein
MPAGQLYSGLRGVLYFDGAGVTTPLVILGVWLLGGVLLLLVAEVVTRRGEPAPTPAA